MDNTTLGIDKIDWELWWIPFYDEVTKKWIIRITSADNNERRRLKFSSEKEALTALRENYLNKLGE